MKYAQNKVIKHIYDNIKHIDGPLVHRWALILLIY